MDAFWIEVVSKQTCILVLCEDPIDATVNNTGSV